MKLLDIIVKWVKGIAHVEARLGTLTLVEGGNGRGKSSLWRAIKAALGGGEDLAKIAFDPRPRGLDMDADEIEPSVLIRADDNGSLLEIERVVGSFSIRRQVGNTAAMEDVPSPVSWMKGRLPLGAGLDIAAWLTAKAEDRAQQLLLALPLEMNRAAMLEAVGITAAELPNIPGRLHPLQELGLVHGALFDRRRDVKRDAKQARGTADDLLGKVPRDIPAARAAEIAQLEEQAGALHRKLGELETAADAAEASAVERAEQAQATEDSRLCTAFQAARKQREAAQETLAAERKGKAAVEVQGYTAHKAQLRADAEKRVAEIWALLEREEAELERLSVACATEAAAAIARDKAEAQTEINALAASTEALREKADQVLEDARKAARQARVAADVTIAQARDAQATLRTRLATLREQEASADRDRVVRRTADEQAQKAGVREAEAARLTEALERLTAYRATLAKDLPIDGLEIEGREIRVRGLPLEELNAAQRVEIAVKVAVLHARRAALPLLLVDDAEKLDADEHYPALLRALLASGCQSVVCRVTRGDLRVTPIDNEQQLEALVGRAA